jgi:membrane associated rhomboid family serine protease
VLTGVHCTRCGRPICTDCMIPAPVGHHCPTCVAEARSEFRRGPGRRIAVADAKAVSLTTLLLVAIAGMFVIEIVKGGSSAILDPRLQDLVDLGAAVPFLISQGEWWRLLSSMFLHAGIIHLLLNSWGLYLFGTVVERQIYGRVRFVAIYLVSGFIGSVAAYALHDANDCARLGTVGVGASGAIFGLVGAVGAYAFFRRGTAVGRAYLQWAVMIIVINLIIGQSIPGIDNVAHIGGAVGGAACAIVAEFLGRRQRNPVLEWLGYGAIVVIGAIVVAQHSAAVRAAIPLC